MQAEPNIGTRREPGQISPGSSAITKLKIFGAYQLAPQAIQFLWIGDSPLKSFQSKTSAPPSLRAISITLCLSLAVLLPAAAQAPAGRGPSDRGPSPRNAGGRPFHNEAERAAHWKPVAIPYHRAALTPRDQQMVAKLADACRLMDMLYWHQSDLGGWAVYRVTQSEVLARLFNIMGSRYDLLEENETFLGEATMPPGHELYTYGLTRPQIEHYVSIHPEAKSAIYNERTVVRGTPGNLQTVPYHEAYAEWLRPMANDLRAAAKLSSDPAFAKYLNLRADALLSDDYYASDIAWLDLKNPKIDLIFAPYETYLDNLLGVKTSYGGAILIRNEAESRKLATYQKNEAAMQQALPIPAEDKPSKQGQFTPMEVVDAPLRSGDLHYGYQAVADDLPNDARIHAEKGSKKIFFKNFMDARVSAVILPIAAKMLDPAQVGDVTGDGYLTAVILHEISHGLGPAYAHIDGKQIDIREAIGSYYGGLEEAKADVTGIFLAKWLVDQKILPQSALNSIYGSYVAGIFRTLRFGAGETHGRAETMEFNVLLEHGALHQNDAGRYTIDYTAMPDAIASLAQQLLIFESQGDRAGVEAWFKKYEVIPPALTKALESTKDVPVEIVPEFELSKGVRP